MIKLFRATREGRARDKRRQRYIFQIGARLFHLSANDTASLIKIGKRLERLGRA